MIYWQKFRCILISISHILLQITDFWPNTKIIKLTNNDPNFLIRSFVVYYLLMNNFIRSFPMNSRTCSIKCKIYEKWVVINKTDYKTNLFFVRQVHFKWGSFSSVGNYAPPKHGQNMISYGVIRFIVNCLHCSIQCNTP